MTRIKECLDRMGQTQKWLALTLGVKQPSVHDWITGKNKPTAANLQRLAALFNVSTDYLLGLTDDPAPAVVSADTWDVESAFSAPEDESIRIMARGMGRLSPENREKLLTVAKTLFATDFGEADK